MLCSAMVTRAFLIAFFGFSAALWAVQLLARQDATHVAALMNDDGDARTVSSGGAARPARPDRASTTPLALVELRRDADSHFRANATVNGRPLTMLVDSGASLVVLTEADARTVGIYLSPSDFTATARTAGGEVKMAPVTIDRLSVNGIERRNIAGAVVPAGLLGQSLLGQSYLAQLSEVTIRDDVMRLR